MRRKGNLPRIIAGTIAMMTALNSGPAVAYAATLDNSESELIAEADVNEKDATSADADTEATVASTVSDENIDVTSDENADVVSEDAETIEADEVSDASVTEDADEALVASVTEDADETAVQHRHDDQRLPVGACDRGFRGGFCRPGHQALLLSEVDSVYNGSGGADLSVHPLCEAAFGGGCAGGGASLFRRLAVLFSQKPGKSKKTRTFIRI